MNKRVKEVIEKISAIAGGIFMISSLTFGALFIKDLADLVSIENARSKVYLEYKDKDLDLKKKYTDSRGFYTTEYHEHKKTVSIEEQEKRLKLEKQHLDEEYSLFNNIKGLLISVVLFIIAYVIFYEI